MLSKCANPSCTAKLHYLHDGKIFRVDIGPILHAPGRSDEAREQVSGATVNYGKEIGGLQVVASRDGIYRPEYFWLCRECAAEMTLGVQQGSVVVLPLEQRPPLCRAAAS